MISAREAAENGLSVIEVPSQARLPEVSSKRRCEICGAKLRSGNQDTICSPCAENQVLDTDQQERNILLSVKKGLLRMRMEREGRPKEEIKRAVQRLDLRPAINWEEVRLAVWKLDQIKRMRELAKSGRPGMMRALNTLNAKQENVEEEEEPTPPSTYQNAEEVLEPKEGVTAGKASLDVCRQAKELRDSGMKWEAIEKEIPVLRKCKGMTAYNCVKRWEKTSS